MQTMERQSVAPVHPKSRRPAPWPVEFYRSAVGKKWVMALTGIALMAYVFAHMFGNFKLYFGAAAGVGKTFAMLEAARELRADGVDVVVGVVETHGRAETEALLKGLEVLPRRRLAYKEQTLEEMDLDALIARRPQIALVDELAHTNAPGSRHPKRYLDVEELLSKGLDVYTAVNIQHIESLNDVVAQITHVRVRETVPDKV